MKYKSYCGEELDLLEVSPNRDEDEKISYMLHEAEHIFDWHRDGHWDETKQLYAKNLAPYLLRHPKIIQNILNKGNRVFNMIAYAAVDLNKISNESN